jgi:uncharacterized protein involved in exopolysaccharide biosynthesis
MESSETNWQRVYTLRDFSSAIWRQAPTAITCFLLVVIATVALVFMIPERYQSELRLLVKHDRADSLVTSSQGTERAVTSTVTEEELNSEVELLQAHDLLEQVAQATKLSERLPAPGWSQLPQSSFGSLMRATGLSQQVGGTTSRRNTADETLARAVKQLRDDLQVAPIRRTWMISVTYASPDAHQSQEVLETLSRLYLEKHLAVRRPPGTRQFFVDQAAESAEELRAVQEQLRQFGEKHGTVSPITEKEAVLTKFAEFEGQRRETEAAIAEAVSRLAALQRERERTPARHTASITTGDASGLTQDIQAKIVALELRRTELLQKFTPEYRLIGELDQQIASAKQVLDEARKSQLKQETIADNPTMRWLENEIARVRTELDALVARKTALGSTTAKYRAEALELDADNVQQSQLVRALKAAEDRYVLYQRKQEEARISDALDRTRIANVAVVQPPEIPFEPLPRRRAMWIAIGLLAAFFLSLAIALIKDFAASAVRIRTPDELQTTLVDVPVLAWVPAARRR